MSDAYPVRSRVPAAHALFVPVFVAVLLSGILAAPATAQPGPTQPAPSVDVSPVTPRGPIQLTARPPKIATPEPAANTTQVTARYVGSLTCQRCHASTYERWSHTRMANAAA